jgi:hypothetical protein
MILLFLNAILIKNNHCFSNNSKCATYASPDLIRKLQMGVYWPLVILYFKIIQIMKGAGFDYNNLDRQIADMFKCKPLPELEVKALC